VVIRAVDEQGAKWIGMTKPPLVLKVLCGHHYYALIAVLACAWVPAGLRGSIDICGRMVAEFRDAVNNNCVLD
jgi:hypothetical protein